MPIVLPDWNVAVLDSSGSISANNNGRTFFLSAATAFDSVLPSPSMGLRYTFVVKSIPAGAGYTISTTGRANAIKTIAFSSAPSQRQAAHTQDFWRLTFQQGRITPGDRIELWSDGSFWFAHICTFVFGAVSATTYK